MVSITPTCVYGVEAPLVRKSSMTCNDELGIMVQQDLIYFGCPFSWYGQNGQKDDSGNTLPDWAWLDKPQADSFNVSISQGAKTEHETVI